ncbi:hypothetical protein JW948_12310 [bacterium]|nr:hypothetical protein [bacterium]
MRSVAHLAITAVLFAVTMTRGQNVSIQKGGDWVITVGSVTTPGDNPVGTYESLADQVTLRVQYGGDWIVYINKNDVNWHANFYLERQRTSDGNGGGSISGGDSYDPITGTVTQFFQGNKNRNGIDIQYRLSATGAVTADTYTTTIEFTITGY